ncbi:MAG TPA: GAF domain-containing sensor histidine kinase [Actinomycetota bacterium]
MRPRKAGDRGPQLPPGRIGFIWVGLAVWVVLLIAIDMTSRTIGLQEQQVPYLIAAALASFAVVTLVAFVRLAGTPTELRTLRILAVLLPSAFVLSIEVILYFVEIDEAITEVGEHVVAMAILSAGAVPFSVYVFRAFARLHDELAHRAQHLQALHETSMRVTAEPSLGQLYERIARGVRGVVSSDRAALLLAPDGGGSDVLVADPPVASLDPGEADLMASVRATGATERVSQEGWPLLAVPVRRQGRTIGAMAAMREGGPGFSVEDELLLGMFAVAASAALENARRLEEAQLLATVEERERIARDLHDDLGQLLGFLTAKIQAAQELVGAGRQIQAQDELAGLERATRTLGAQVREAILGLRARVGTDRPLCRALEDYVAEFGIQAGLTTTFESSPNAGGRLPGPSQYQLLRVVQEALSNARRHAEAHRVTVRLTESDGYVELSIADDGRGFTPDYRRAGFGLKTMSERVRALNGEFDVSSAPGRGAVVKAKVPLVGG